MLEKLSYTAAHLRLPLPQTLFLFLANGFSDHQKLASDQDYWEVPLLTGGKSSHSDARDEVI